MQISGGGGRRSADAELSPGPKTPCHGVPLREWRHQRNRPAPSRMAGGAQTEELAARMHGLTAAQITQFHQEGYLMVPDVFDPAELEPVRQELAGVVDREARRAYAAGLLPGLYEDEPFETRLTRICQHTDAGYKAVMGRGGGGHAGEELV